jgi:hypothetical protein
MLDDVKRIEIAKALEALATQDAWSADVWQRCYDLVGANAEKDDLLRHVHDDLIHYHRHKPLRIGSSSQGF